MRKNPVSIALSAGRLPCASFTERITLPTIHSSVTNKLRGHQPFRTRRHLLTVPRGLTNNSDLWSFNGRRCNPSPVYLTPSIRVLIAPLISLFQKTLIKGAVKPNYEKTLNPEKKTRPPELLPVIRLCKIK